ncbi:MAG: IS66 family transposase [Acidobacteriaceae bacterium]
MKTTPARVVSDLTALQALLTERDRRIAALTEERDRYSARAAHLQEQLNLALARRYAARSEVSPDQIRLFDEAERDVAAAEVLPEAPETEAPGTHVAEHTRQRPGRRPLPAALPRVVVTHTLPESERICPHDGRRLTEIGVVTSEQLDLIPARIQVLRQERTQYACACGQCIRTAPLPVPPIPKSMASPGLLAHIVVSKYQDALPLYRQEQILTRIGVDLPRATLASWMIQTGILVQPLINLLRDRLLAYDLIQMDETPVQVLKEPGKSAQSQSYLWVQRGGPPGLPVVLFDYDPSRSATVPQRLLAGFQGILQTDGYDGYNAVVTAQGLTHAGCLAHARRKFDEVLKAQGKHRRPGLAEEGLKQIQKLYAVEKALRTATPEMRHAVRTEQARPLWAALRSWLDTARPQVPPQMALGKALAYLDREWDKLVVYLEDGRLEIDNNRCENAIRPFVIGRRNWLFSDSVRGVKASANLYSLIESAKACGLEPYAYLRRVFTELPQAQTLETLEALLPGQPAQGDRVLPALRPRESASL